MKRVLFNDNWNVVERVDLFAPSSEGKKVTLPHDAMISQNRESSGSNKKGYYKNSTWEYKKTFHVPEDYRNKAVCFLFEGVYRGAMVYINNELAGNRPYGYSSFIIEADRFLNYGADNEIRVTVRTGDDSRWYTGAGIYRDVYMLTGGGTHIAQFGVKISTLEINAHHAVVSVATRIKNDSGNSKTKMRIETQVFDSGGNLVAADTAPIVVYRTESAVLRQRLCMQNPALWDLDSPNLYSCAVKAYDEDGALIDECGETFGLRSLKLDVCKGLSLNGKQIKLRGACVHHDNGPLGAVSVYAAEERRVEKLKSAGFNSIRMAHHPASPALLDACDRLGMLVMDEAFDMWTVSKTSSDYSLDFCEWWERDICAMVDKDFNRPSVILYSIGNEIPDTGTAWGTEWGRRLAEKIREMDSSRFTINCINGMLSAMPLLMKMRKRAKEASSEINAVMIDFGAMMKTIMTDETVASATEESFACVDISGYNYMDARYLSDMEKYSNRIICGSETFPKDIDKNWRLVLDNPRVIGDFTWTGWDYIGEPGTGQTRYNDEQQGQFPFFLAATGDIDITGFRRPPSYYREIVFGLRQEPYIAVQRPEHYGEKAQTTPWSWSDSISSWTWKGFESCPIKVEVYSNAERVELLLNGISKGSAPAGEANRFMAEFDIVYESGELMAVSYNGNKETGRYSLKTAQGPVHLVLTPERETIAQTRLAYVNITLNDAQGNLYNTADQKITIEVHNGTLAGLGSANPRAEGSFADDSCLTYDGRALAVIKSAGPGKVIIKARGDNCEAQTEIIVTGEIQHEKGN
jgi:beta-galactosidase